MNNQFKKILTYGTLASVVYASTPFCKDCFLEKHNHLPHECEYITYATPFVSMISGSASTDVINNINVLNNTTGYFII